ncbi:MAG: hypothetical protein NTZ59_10885 [Bacteroidetes bacterium]|jgi:hypothetical protein|nr:hypothetical protein [Bacteroidota bacterium]
MLKDNTKYGVVLGFLAPLIGMFVFYKWKLSVLSFKEFFQFILMEKKMLTSMITFSLLANAIIFTLFINTDKDHTAKGIFISTCVWAVLAIVLKIMY